MKLRDVTVLACLVSSAIVTNATPAGAANAPLMLRVGPGAAQRSGPQLPWKPLERGRQPQPGADVRCPAGCSSSLLGGGTVTADPGATIVALVPGFVRPPWTAGGRQTSRIGLREGTLHVDLGRTSRQIVTVEASGVTFVVRAGSAHVVVGPDHTAIAAIGEGAFIQRDTTWIKLAAGEAIVLKPGEVASPRRHIASPVWGDVAEGRAPIELSWSGEPVPVGAAWGPVSGAETYRVQIARDAAFGAVLETIAGRRSAFDSAPLPPGRYFARVFARDGEGLDSAPSTPLALRVTRAVLPPGSIVDAAHRMVILPGSQGIRLLEPAGLEVALDRRAFAAPPPELALGAKEMRFVWLRLGDDHAAEAPLLLKRRSLRADIEFTPRLPTWPRDPLTIEVMLVDPSGRSDVSSIKPRLHLTVGATEVPVTWAQRGAKWIAELQPIPIDGPAVIRVDADDDFGAPIGVAFNEVVLDASVRSASR
jgi:hypothetical protein